MDEFMSTLHKKTGEKKSKSILVKLLLMKMKVVVVKINFVSGGLECLWRKPAERKNARPDFTCTCARMHARARTHEHAHAHDHARTYARARTHEHARARTHERARTSMHARARTCTHAIYYLTRFSAIPDHASLDLARTIIRASANCRSCRRRLRGRGRRRGRFPLSPVGTSPC